MSATDKAYKHARRLRRERSLPEVLLWARLRKSHVRIRRQHPVGPYVLDFYCPATKLGIEVDGIAHGMGHRPQRDVVRTQWLANHGIELLRIPAVDILKDPDEMASAVLMLCSVAAKPLHRPKPQAEAGPPPHGCAAGRSK